MKAINDFVFTAISELSSQLMIGDKRLDIKVDGLCIDAQYRLKDGIFLIFSNDDCPNEEVLHIILLNTAYKVIDQIDVGLEYHSGIFSNAKPLSETEIEFEFMDENKYLLSIDGQGKRFNKVKSNPEIHYTKTILNRRYLSLTRTT